MVYFFYQRTYISYNTNVETNKIVSITQHIVKYKSKLNKHLLTRRVLNATDISQFF